MELCYHFNCFHTCMCVHSSSSACRAQSHFSRKRYEFHFMILIIEVDFRNIYVVQFPIATCVIFMNLCSTI